MTVLMIFPVLCFLVSQTLAHESSPVIIWGNYKAKAPPTGLGLGRLRSLQFSQLLHNLLEPRPVVLLFTEHNLSIEDFTLRNEADDGIETPAFPNLLNISHSPGFVYLPAVEGAVTVLHQLTHHGYSLAQYDEESPPNLSSPTILMGKLREAVDSESRLELLREHDTYMHQIAEDAIRRYGQVLVLYTGKHASYVPPSRHKRQVEVDEVRSNDIVLTNQKSIYIVTRSPIEYRRGNTVTNLTSIAYASTEFYKKNVVTLDVKFKNSEGTFLSLDWVFNSPSELSSWSLETIKVEESGVEMREQTGLQIQAPGGYSYFCARDIIFSGRDKDGVEHSLTLHGIQAQPTVTGVSFGPPADCIPYFSQPIWTGLLVSSLLLAVLVLTILLLLDIRTMDKFDNPKGKEMCILSPGKWRRTTHYVLGSSLGASAGFE